MNIGTALRAVSGLIPVREADRSNNSRTDWSLCSRAAAPTSSTNASIWDSMAGVLVRDALRIPGWRVRSACSSS